GHEVEDQRAHHGAKHHRGQNVLREPVRHGHTPRYYGTGSLADFQDSATRLACANVCPMFPLRNGKRPCGRLGPGTWRALGEYLATTLAGTWGDARRSRKTGTPAAQSACDSHQSGE